MQATSNAAYALFELLNIHAGRMAAATPSHPKPPDPLRCPDYFVQNAVCYITHIIIGKSRQRILATHTERSRAPNANEVEKPSPPRPPRPPSPPTHCTHLCSGHLCGICSICCCPVRGRVALRTRRVASCKGACQPAHSCHRPPIAVVVSRGCGWASSTAFLSTTIILHTHSHIHTHIYIYTYIYIAVSVSVCAQLYIAMRMRVDHYT